MFWGPLVFSGTMACRLSHSLVVSVSLPAFISVSVSEADTALLTGVSQPQYPSCTPVMVYVARSTLFFSLGLSAPSCVAVLPISLRPIKLWLEKGQLQLIPVWQSFVLPILMDPGSYNILHFFFLGCTSQLVWY